MTGTSGGHNPQNDRDHDPDDPQSGPVNDADDDPRNRVMESALRRQGQMPHGQEMGLRGFQERGDKRYDDRGVRMEAIA